MPPPAHAGPIDPNDPQQWNQKVARSYPALRHLAARILHDRGEAEDVVQQVLCRLWSTRRRLGNVENFEAYLQVCVRNQARTVRRPSARRPPRVSFEHVCWDRPCPHAAAPPCAAQQAECLELLRRAAAALSPAQRAVWRELLRDPDASSRQVARRLDCSHKNVLHLLRRLRNALRPHLADYLPTTGSAP